MKIVHEILICLAVGLIMSALYDNYVYGTVSALLMISILAYLKMGELCFLIEEANLLKLKTRRKNKQ